jgi:hypothetical protein
MPIISLLNSATISSIFHQFHFHQFRSINSTAVNFDDDDDLGSMRPTPQSRFSALA